jgi:hypothetical protein
MKVLDFNKVKEEQFESEEATLKTLGWLARGKHADSDESIFSVANARKQRKLDNARLIRRLKQVNAKKGKK